MHVTAVSHQTILTLELHLILEPRLGSYEAHGSS